MAATDLVPCFYTGQNCDCDPPARIHTRAEVRQFKEAKLGKFVSSGKFFMFFQMVAERLKQIWDGPIGIGNLLPFSKSKSTGDRLHYDMGPKGLARHGLYHRRDEDGAIQVHSHMIRVSSRSRFNRQMLTA